MNDVSIIINGMRFDAVNEENHCSCKGCDIKKYSPSTDCRLPALCKWRNIIFKKSDKKFER